MRAPGSRTKAAISRPPAGAGAPQGEPAPRAEALTWPSEALTAPQGNLDALRALEAALGGGAFWTPTILNGLPPGAVEAYVEQQAGLLRVEKGRRSGKTILREARAIRGEDPITRISRMSALLGEEEKSPARRALAWAAGLPLEAIGGRLKDNGRVLDLEDTNVRWLPDGLHLHKLFLGWTPISELPTGLVVRLYLGLQVCSKLRRLPDDLSAELIDAQGSGIEEIPSSARMLSLDLTDCPNLQRLPEGLKLRSLDISNTGVAEIPQGTQVSAVFRAIGCPNLRRLPPGLHPSSIDCSNSGLEALPPDLTDLNEVGVSNCKNLHALPESLRVRQVKASGSGLRVLPAKLRAYRLDISGTPLDQLSDEELIRMAPGLHNAVIRR